MQLLKAQSSDSLFEPSLHSRTWICRRTAPKLQGLHRPGRREMIEGQSNQQSLISFKQTHGAKHKAVAGTGGAARAKEVLPTLGHLACDSQHPEL